MKDVLIRDANGGMLEMDKFNRVQVANPKTLGDYIPKYGKLTSQFDSIVTGTGATTHVPNSSGVRLTTPADGDAIVFSSRKYHRYQAGRAGIVTLSLVPGESVSGVTKRWGYFDSQNGLFFELSGGKLYAVTRSYTSGSVVDTKVAIDSSDRLGDGDILDYIDVTDLKGTIFQIDFQWLGTGVTKFSIAGNDGNMRVFHEFRNPNQNTAPYMTTATLPVRFEQTNDSGDTTDTSMLMICATVASSGGGEAVSAPRGFGTSKDVSTNGEQVLVAFRLASTFNSIANRMNIVPTSFNASSFGGSSIVRIKTAPTVDTDGTWTACGSNTGVEYSTDTTFTDYGQCITAAKYLYAQTTGNPNNLNITLDSLSTGFKGLTLTRSADNTSSDMIVITVERIGSDEPTVSGGMDWEEQR